jgi:hypothetical protein
MSNFEKRPSPRRRGITLALTASGLLLVSTAAYAGTGDRDATAEETARVRAALETKGYTDVHDIEVDDGRFELDARNAKSEKVDLELDLETLEVLYEDRD